MSFDPFTAAYIEAALWTSSISESDDRGMDTEYSSEDIDGDSLEAMAADCARFQSEAGDLLDGVDSSQAGHDFWLDRNGHGAGAWDRGNGETGERLAAIARTFGEAHLFLSDDEDSPREPGSRPIVCASG